MNGRSLLAFALLLSATSARAGCGSMPPVLPLNGEVTGGTCDGNQNEPCNDIVYPNASATSRFTLDAPSTMTIAIAGGSTFQPAGYLSGGVCDQGSCGPDLPPGDYCLTVTASPGSGQGACGCFEVFVETVSNDTIYLGGFD